MLRGLARNGFGLSERGSAAREMPVWNPLRKSAPEPAPEHAPEPAPEPSRTRPEPLQGTAPEPLCRTEPHSGMQSVLRKKYEVDLKALRTSSRQGVLKTLTRLTSTQRGAQYPSAGFCTNGSEPRLLYGLVSHNSECTACGASCKGCD